MFGIFAVSFWKTTKIAITAPLSAFTNFNHRQFFPLGDGRLWCLIGCDVDIAQQV